MEEKNDGSTTTTIKITPEITTPGEIVTTTVTIPTPIPPDPGTDPDNSVTES